MGVEQGVGAARAGDLGRCMLRRGPVKQPTGSVLRSPGTFRGLILPFGSGSAGDNLEGTETTRVEE